MASTPLLGLSLPADGTTNWGTLVNTSITALLDSAVAGTTTLTTDADVTLSTTTEAANEARQAVILCTGARAALRTITAPAQSKTYVVINATTGGFGVKIVGAGPTTGVTIPSGKAYMVAWNGSDFVTTGVATIDLTTEVTGILPTANGGTNLGGATPFTANGVVYASSASALATGSVLTFNGTILGVNGVNVGRGAGAISSNTAIGSSALISNTTGSTNTALGVSALASNTTGGSNTSIGQASLYSSTTGAGNTAVGASTLFSNTTGGGNIAVGAGALFLNTTGGSNTTVGVFALYNNTTGSSNTAVGYVALNDNTTGTQNTAVGRDALASNTTGAQNTAIGFNALNLSLTWDNTTGLGRDAQVTGSDQIQLGNSSTTTYVFGTVQNRSDLRDKADVRDTTLGLNFINALRPVDYRWDMREDYRPERPIDLSESATDAEKTAHKIALNQWREACKYENLARDGSKKRNRYHHGLIAQEVKATLDGLGVDFGGYQNHKVAGGEDVLSIGYDELIAPLIKAIQELTARLEALEAK